MHGIKALHFNLPGRELAIEADSKTIEKCLSAIRKAGYKATITIPGKTTDVRSVSEDTWKMWTALAIACMVEIVELFFPDINPYSPVDIGCRALAVVSIVLSGLQTYRKGLAALLRLQLNINALMSIAVTGAFIIGEWPEAAMVMSLFAVSEWLERRASLRADNAIRKLLDLTPDTTEVFRDGQWQRQAVKDMVAHKILYVLGSDGKAE